MKELTRRNLLKGFSAMSTVACCQAAMGITHPELVYGQTAAGNDNLAVFFNQFGGCDPLNSFAVPYGLQKYYDLRPGIGLPQASVLQINEVFGMHPALANLHRLYQAGNVALIYSTGEPVGTRSHFTSQDIMSLGVGSQNSGERRGWIGRLGDLYFRERELNTFALGTGQKLDFVGDRIDNAPLVLSKLADFSLAPDSKSGMSQVAFDSELQETVADSVFNQSKTLYGVRRSARGAVSRTYRDSARIERALVDDAPTLTYPTTKAGQFLRDVAVLRRANFGTKLCYGGVGGWDNHANQGGVTGTQANQLRDLDQAVGMFEADMKSINRWNSVSICIFTEFGRCVAQNTSLGTDHGWGSVMLVIGGKVKGGTFGSGPSLTDLTKNRWLEPKIDYRNPLREIINWMGYDATPVFPGQYQRTNIDLFKA